MSGATMTTKAAVDPLIQKPYLEELAAAYLQGADPRGPMVSPIHADLHGLPPLLIQVGVRGDAAGRRGQARRHRRAAEVPTTLRICRR